VEIAVTGERRLSLGDCCLCEGVEGRERVVAAGDSSEESVSVMSAAGISLLDIFLNIEVPVVEPIRVRSSSVGGRLDIEYCLLEVERPENARKDACEGDCAGVLVSEHQRRLDSDLSLRSWLPVELGPEVPRMKKLLTRSSRQVSNYWLGGTIATLDFSEGECSRSSVRRCPNAASGNI